MPLVLYALRTCLWCHSLTAARPTCPGQEAFSQAQTRATATKLGCALASCGEYAQATVLLEWAM